MRFYGKNSYDAFCRKCSCPIKAGEGNVCRKGNAWIVHHEDCSGVKPHMRHSGGWVYLLSGAKPYRPFVKIGITSDSLAHRMVAQVYASELLKSLVWASPTQNRFMSEATVHSTLEEFRVDKSHGLGNEVFDVPIDLALDAVANVTGHECTRYEWERSGVCITLKNDPIPRTVYL